MTKQLTERIKELEQACLRNYYLQKKGEPIIELQVINREALELEGFYFNQSRDAQLDYLLAKIVDKGRGKNDKGLSYLWFLVERKTRDFNGVPSYTEWFNEGRIKDRTFRFGEECVFDATYERDFWAAMYPGIPNLKSFLEETPPDEQNIHLFLEGLSTQEHYKKSHSREEFVRNIIQEMVKFNLFNYLPQLVGVPIPTKEQETRAFLHALQKVPSKLELANIKRSSISDPEDYGTIIWQKLKKRRKIKDIATMPRSELSGLAGEILNTLPN